MQSSDKWGDGPSTDRPVEVLRATRVLRILSRGMGICDIPEARGVYEQVVRSDSGANECVHVSF